MSEGLERSLDALCDVVEATGRTVGEVVATLASLSDEVTEIGDELPTKREFYAALALAASLATTDVKVVTVQQCAAIAVAAADALIYELSKPVGAKEGA